MSGGDPSGGFGRTGPSSRIAFEEAKARAEEQRGRAAARGGTALGERARRLASLLFAALGIGLMAYSVAGFAGPIAGLVTLALLVVGALALWRLWR